MMHFLSRLQCLWPQSREDWWWAGAATCMAIAYLGYFFSMSSLSHGIHLQFRERQLDALPPYEWGSALRFCQGCSELSKSVRLDGWSDPEADGTWTMGSEATLAIRLPNPNPPRIEMVSRLHAMIGKNGQQEVSIRVNGRPVGLWAFKNASEEVRRITFAAPEPSPDPVEITFVVAHPVAPASLGDSSDIRRLGIHVRELRLEAALQKAPSE